jgi:hypothetical protein
VPSADPYSWSAAGTPWTVQSWGASLVYGLAERHVGLIGIRLIDAACTVGLVLILWRLSRKADSLVARFLVGALVVSMGTGLWVERPLLFGAVLLGLVLLVADGDIDPRWLVPIMWVWVNVHGSFPFGVAVLVLFAVGRWLDERKRPELELRAVGWAALGTLLGGINPVGPKVLWFPVEMLSRREAFQRVAEWEPPHWNRGVEWLFAAQLVAAVGVVLFRNRSWRSILPLVVFGAAALTSTRNILQASIVLTPILAAGLAGWGSIDGTRRPRLLRPVAAALALLLVLVALIGVTGPDTALTAYPIKATTYMRRHGLLDGNDRVVHQDFVGNFIEYRYGPDQARVFMDDRVDMYPLTTIRRYMVLISPDGGYQKVLTDTRATAVLWKRDTDFARWISRSPRWDVVFRDRTYLVAVPAGGRST